MSAKQYLKMADVFPSEMRVGGDSDNLIIDDVGIIIGCYSGDKMAEHVLHAINSHDELVAENERLREEIAVALGEKQSTVIIPEGWQLVPVEPTPEMRLAGVAAQAEKLKRYALGGSLPPIDHGIPDAYRAMLAAAPRLGGE